MNMLSKVLFQDMNIGNASYAISLRLLNELTKELTITQKALSGQRGIVLGLANTYMKKLCKKGYIKVKTLSKNRKYIITPKGFTEKARLTYSYMKRSIDYFKDVRQKIEQIYATMMASKERIFQAQYLYGRGYSGYKLRCSAYLIDGT